MCTPFFHCLSSYYTQRQENKISLPHNNMIETKSALHNEFPNYSDKQTYESTDEEEDENNDMFDGSETRCECGIILAKGWQCDNCRVNCSDCNRALTKDPEDFCTRCNIKCQTHGLFKTSAHSACPQC